MKHLFIFNPRSIPVQADMDRLLKEIGDCFVDREDDYSVHVSRYSRDAIGFIRKWMAAVPADEIVRVYAVGGDGILFDCLNGIVGLPNAELAIVPYGNFNDMIRAFGENKTALFRNIALQTVSPVIPTDIINCGANYALNFCTIGIESDAIMAALNMYNRIAGRVRKFRRLNFFLYTTLFVLGGVKAALNRKVLNQHYTITVDGEDFSGLYVAVNIANGPCYGGDKNPVVTAKPDDGFLDTVFLRATGSFRILRIMVSYMKGEFRRFPKEFTWKRLRKIEIRSEDPLLVDMDGEAFFDTSLAIKIIPGAVKIVAPGGAVYKKRAEVEVYE
jgi:diacylglycerol kinase family enzyme